MSEDARKDEKFIIYKYGRLWEVKFLNNKSTDTQGFMLYNKDLNTFKISFRGTQQLRDWATDFNAFHMIYPYDNHDSKIRVHRGIHKAYLSVRPEIHEFIKPRISNIDLAVFTGHSLGGALTTAAAVDFQYNYNDYISKENILGYASGNPAFGNNAFVESFNKRLPNFITTYKRNDWVPHLPPSWFGGLLQGGYRKAGVLNPIGRSNYALGLLIWFLTKKRLNKLLENVSNHTIDMYREDLS